MQSMNLFVLTRSKTEFCTQYENVLANREHVNRIKDYEYETIVELVEELKGKGCQVSDFDGFYISFVIDYIGKEFDLLKIDRDNKVINIELKSQKVDEGKIEKQLLRNQYYLRYLAPQIHLFTYVKEEKSLYTVDGEAIKKCDMDELIAVIKEMKKFENGDIKHFFQAKNFLISPLNTPERFAEDNYFLTPQQEEIKREIVKKGVTQKSNLLWGITGSAGTGKTLLLYDIMKYCSDLGRACVIHSGILCDGHTKLNALLSNADIIDAKSAREETLEGYEYIFVDEAQRIYSHTLKVIIKYAETRQVPAVFSYDFFQTLSVTEQNRNIPEILKMRKDFQERELTKKIRTNKEIASFVRNLLNLKDVSDVRYQYHDIDILYADNVEEADDIIDLYRVNKEYVFIGYTQSIYHGNQIDNFPGDFNTHHVIGQEFDKVLIMLDDNFRYEMDGRLQGRPHPNPDYLFYKLLYQGISRAREKLCILVLGNRELFEKIVSIKFNMIS